MNQVNFEPIYIHCASLRDFKHGWHPAGRDVFELTNVLGARADREEAEVADKAVILHELSTWLAVSGPLKRSQTWLDLSSSTCGCLYPTTEKLHATRLRHLSFATLLIPVNHTHRRRGHCPTCEALAAHSKWLPRRDTNESLTMKMWE